MAEPGTHSSRRINTLVRHFGFKKYLEVGVSTGSTFCAVAAEQRTAVDPRFAFDFAPHQNHSTRFFQITSDEYFIRRDQEDCFDIFFLDGLHTFEQIFRDFCCSLSCAHSESLWLIDDTVPNDVFSALPNESDTKRFRGESGNAADRSWHGDVFKIVFAIHDFFPNLSYCTINTGGNPQTLVWREPRSRFTPKFNSLEAISRLSFFDFRKNAEVMKFCDESTGLKMAIESVEKYRSERRSRKLTSMTQLDASSSGSWLFSPRAHVGPKRKATGNILEYAPPHDVDFKEVTSIGDLGRVPDPHKIRLYPSMRGIKQLPLFDEASMPEEVIRQHYSADSIGALPPVFIYGLAGYELASGGILHKNGRAFVQTDVLPSYISVRFHPDRHSLGEAWRGSLYDREAEVIELDTPVAVALHSNTTYGHFLLEMLPRLGLLAQLRSMGIVSPLAVPSNSPQFIRKIVSLYFGDDEIVFYDPRSQRIRAPCFIAPAMMQLNHTFHPAFNFILNDLKQRVLGGIDSKSFSTSKRIYLSHSRLRDGWHGITNEDEVEKVMADFGFSIIHPQDLSFEQQLTMYADAECIASEYSSAAHNSLFSPRGTSVFCINRINWYQSHICALRSQPIAYVKPADGVFIDYRVPHDSPSVRFTVNCAELGQQLNSFLSFASALQR